MTSAVPSAMTCPHCHVALTMSERQGIEIDYCPQCRGVWLDRGELDKIIERSSRELAPPAQPSQRPYDAGPAPSYGQREATYRPDPGYKQKRQKSWIEDIFD